VIATCRLLRLRGEAWVVIRRRFRSEKVCCLAVLASSWEPCWRSRDSNERRRARVNERSKSRNPLPALPPHDHHPHTLLPRHSLRLHTLPSRPLLLFKVLPSMSFKSTPAGSGTSTPQSANANLILRRQLMGQFISFDPFRSSSASTGSALHSTRSIDLTEPGQGRRLTCCVPRLPGSFLF
jgi:hypothetical protein